MEKITFWCPCLSRQILMECEVQENLDVPIIQRATPKVCLELRQRGCTYYRDPECLLGKEIQGNFNEVKP